MRNKVYILILLLISFVCFKINAFAASSATPDQGSVYTELQNEYNKGIVQNKISSSGMVTIYGKSVCNGASCDYQYAGNTKDFKEVLSKSVTCTGGEKYITLGTSAGGANKEDFDGLNGTAYWSEDYNVTCVNESSGDKTVQLNNSTSSSGGTSTGGSSSSGGTSTGGTSTGGTSTGDSSSDDGYSSSDTTDSSQTGVSTYFVVLSVVAIISYVFMIIVKKHTLFKRI